MIPSFVVLANPYGEAGLGLSGVSEQVLEARRLRRSLQVHRGETRCHYSLRRRPRKPTELFLAFRGAGVMKHSRLTAGIAIKVTELRRNDRGPIAVTTVAGSGAFRMPVATSA